MEETVNTKFLGLQIDNHKKWKKHIEEMMHTRSEACYSIWLMAHISNISILKSIYYA